LRDIGGAKVVPSGALRATGSMPMFPLAPGRFLDDATGWPSASARTLGQDGAP